MFLFRQIWIVKYSAVDCKYLLFLQDFILRSKLKQYKWKKCRLFRNIYLETHKTKQIIWWNEWSNIWRSIFDGVERLSYSVFQQLGLIFFLYLTFFTYFWAAFFLNSVPIKVHSVWSLLNWSRSNFIISIIRINFIQINLNLRKSYFRKNLDLRKIVPTHTLNPLGNLCHFFCIFYNTLVIFESIFLLQFSLLA